MGPLHVLITAALSWVVGDWSFNPSGNSEGLKSSSVCLLWCALQMQAQLSAEGGQQAPKQMGKGSGVHRDGLELEGNEESWNHRMV